MRERNFSRQSRTAPEFISCGKCKDLAMGICRKLNTKLAYDEVHYEWPAICAMTNYQSPSARKLPRKEREIEKEF